MYIWFFWILFRADEMTVYRGLLWFKQKARLEDFQFFIQYFLVTVNLVLSCFADHFTNQVDEVRFSKNTFLKCEPI